MKLAIALLIATDENHELRRNGDHCILRQGVSLREEGGTGGGTSHEGASCRVDTKLFQQEQPAGLTGWLFPKADGRQPLLLRLGRDRYPQHQVVEEAAPAQVTLAGKTTMRLRVRSGSTQEKREQVLQEWYRRELKALVPPLLEKWEAELGVKASF